MGECAHTIHYTNMEKGGARMIREIINEFDIEHTIKQVILIGEDGAIRNIELEVEHDDT